MALKLLYTTCMSPSKKYSWVYIKIQAGSICNPRNCHKLWLWTCGSQSLVSGFYFEFRCHGHVSNPSRAIVKYQERYNLSNLLNKNTLWWIACTFHGRQKRRNYRGQPPNIQWGPPSKNHQHPTCLPSLEPRTTV